MRSEAPTPLAGQPAPSRQPVVGGQPRLPGGCIVAADNDLRLVRHAATLRSKPAGREAPRFWCDEIENTRHRTTLPCRSCRSSGLTVDASAICDHGSRASSARAVGAEWSAARIGGRCRCVRGAARRLGRLAWCSARRRTLAAASSATIARGPQSRSIGIIPTAVNKRRSHARSMCGIDVAAMSRGG